TAPPVPIPANPDKAPRPPAPPAAACWPCASRGDPQNPIAAAIAIANDPRMFTAPSLPVSTRFAESLNLTVTFPGRGGQYAGKLGSMRAGKPTENSEDLDQTMGIEYYVRE